MSAQEKIVKAGTIDPDKVISAIQPDQSQLVIINKVEAGIATLEEDYAELPDVKTKDGMTCAKARSKNIATLLKQGDEARVVYTKPLFDEKKRVDTAWNKNISPRLKALKDPLDSAIKEEQGRIAREAKEREVAEQQRQDDIRLRIQKIEGTPATLLEIEDAQTFIVEMNELDYLGFDEFQDDARRTVAAALKKANERIEYLEQKEEDAKALEAQRIEQEKRQAEMDKQQEEMERQRRELEEQQREAQEATAKAEQQRRQIEQAEQQRIADEQARIDREKREAEEAEAQRKADEAEAKRRQEEKAAADKAEAERLERLAPDAEALLAYIGKLLSAKAPALTTPEGEEVLEGIRTTLNNEQEIIKAKLS